MQDIIIIPTFNERKNIPELIKEIFSILPSIRVLVVDDNSPDGTAEEVSILQKRFPNVSLLWRAKKEGLGPAYIAAFEKALEEKNIRSIIMMDADFSHHPKYIPDMLNALRSHDVIIGSRYARGGGTEGWEWYRRLLSWCGNWYFRFITRAPIRDCTGGFNCIRLEALRRVDLKKISAFKGYAFIFALKFYLWKSGSSFLEIPIVFKNRTQGKSKISNRIIQEGIMTPWRFL